MTSFLSSNKSDNVTYKGMCFSIQKYWKNSQFTELSTHKFANLDLIWYYLEVIYYQSLYLVKLKNSNKLHRTSFREKYFIYL